MLRFPLDGEWMALRTPAARIPSHGTNFLGQRFAYDFVRPTGRRLAPFGASALIHAYACVPARRFAAWDACVYAAAGGRVVAARDGWEDRRRINAMVDLVRMQVVDRLRPLRIAADDWRTLTGNYVLIESAVGVALYAHLRQGSLRVHAGDVVSPGDPIGSVGNSGRSSMPHLHFHLMDRAEGLTAIGRPCGFAAYEHWDGERWQPTSGIPRLRERIRVTG